MRPPMSGQLCQHQPVERVADAIPLTIKRIEKSTIARIRSRRGRTGAPITWRLVETTKRMPASQRPQMPKASPRRHNLVKVSHPCLRSRNWRIWKLRQRACVDRTKMGPRMGFKSRRCQTRHPKGAVVQGNHRKRRITPTRHIIPSTLKTAALWGRTWKMGHMTTSNPTKMKPPSLKLTRPYMPTASRPCLTSLPPPF